MRFKVQGKTFHRAHQASSPPPDSEGNCPDWVGIVSPRHTRVMFANKVSRLVNEPSLHEGSSNIYLDRSACPHRRTWKRCRCSRSKC
jgi:hypothetical protein